MSLLTKAQTFAIGRRRHGEFSDQELELGLALAKAVVTPTQAAKALGKSVSETCNLLRRALVAGIREGRIEASMSQDVAERMRKPR